MSGRNSNRAPNNPNNTSSSRNRNRNNNNNNNRNGENGGNQLANLPLPMRSFPRISENNTVPLARTITGFHQGLPQHLYQPPSVPANSPSFFPARSMTSYGIPPPGARPITHVAASQGEEGPLDGNNNSNIPTFLPMRTMSYYPSAELRTRPTDIPAFLEAEGVPLNTPIRRGDTGRGPMPLMSIHIQNGTPENYEEVYRRERARFLYQMLSDRGYFDTPRSLRRPVREVLGIDEPQTPSVLPPANSTGSSGSSGLLSPYLQPWMLQPMQPGFSMPSPSNSYSALSRAPIPTREGGELRMPRANIGANAIDLEDFVDGETVEVLYTPQQARRLNAGNTVRITPSMIMRPTSVAGLIASGSRINPTTRQPIGLRETRTLRIENSNNNQNNIIANNPNNSVNNTQSVSYNNRTRGNQTQGGKRKKRKSTKKNRKY